MLVSTTNNKTLVVANESKTTYNHFSDLQCDICPLYDENLEDKILDNGYEHILFQQNLKSGQQEQLFNSYAFLQKLIEEDCHDLDGSKIGIITFHKAKWFGNPKIKTLQTTLPPYAFPSKSPETWYKHLKVAKANSHTFCFVRNKYNREWTPPKKKTFIMKASRFFQDMRSKAAML